MNDVENHKPRHRGDVCHASEDSANRLESIKSHSLLQVRQDPHGIVNEVVSNNIESIKMHNIRAWELRVR